MLMSSSLVAMDSVQKNTKKLLDLKPDEISLILDNLDLFSKLSLGVTNNYLYNLLRYKKIKICLIREELIRFLGQQLDELIKIKIAEKTQKIKLFEFIERIESFPLMREILIESMFKNMNDCDDRLEACYSILYVDTPLLLKNFMGYIIVLNNKRKIPYDSEGIVEIYLKVFAAFSVLNNNYIFDILDEYLSAYEKMTLIFIAASYGNYRLLEKSYERGYKIHSKAGWGAAVGGHLTCLKYVHENGSLDLRKICNGAARFGHLDCLKYAHENGFDWDATTCRLAARGGHFDCLKYAHENGCDWDATTCHQAAKKGYLDCLKYAHDNGCDWDAVTCDKASKNGHLDCLKYAHENGCIWYPEICYKTAFEGHLECLKYVYNNGCSWDQNTCKWAAYNGQLECLKYAHENGCDWDHETWMKAAEQGYLDCLKYAYENGCPMKREELEFFIAEDSKYGFRKLRKNKHCIAYLKNIMQTLEF